MQCPPAGAARTLHLESDYSSVGSCIFVPLCRWPAHRQSIQHRYRSCRKIVVKNTDSINDTFFSLLSHAEELIDAGRVREARRLIAQFIERKHLDVPMLPAVAALYLRVGKPDQAVITMRQALEQLGGQAELH